MTSRTSDKRLKEVVKYSNEFGVVETASRFNIQVNTVERRLREANERHITVSKIEDREPRVLIFDLETSPIEARLFDVGKQYVGWKHVIKPWAILTWSAKWLCGSEVFGAKVNSGQAHERKDGNIVKELWNLVDEADVVVAHNFHGFDKGKMNSRFIVNNCGPPSPYRAIDTLREARSKFRFLSNSLQYIGRLLCAEDKTATSMSLWDRCVDGDPTGLDDMLRYNKQDVRLLEEVLLKIRPWMTSGPNIGAYYTDTSGRCGRCGSKNVNVSDSHYYTTANRYRALYCNECGGWTRMPSGDLSTEERRSLLRPMAR